MCNVETFTYKYETSKDSIYVAFYKGHKYISKKRGRIYIDDKALIRRRDFRKRIWNESHDMLYEMTNTIQRYTIADMLSKKYGRSRQSWMTFLSSGLFSAAWIDQSILKYKIPMMSWQFYKFAKQMTRGM